MTAPRPKTADADGVPEPSCRDTAAHALTIVRDGVITGEGPTTKGRVHFSRSLDADDAAWCARILTARAVEHEPVSRAEVEALFEINDAATERIGRGPLRRPARQGGCPSRGLRLRSAGAAAHGSAVAGHRYRELGARACQPRRTRKCWSGSPSQMRGKQRGNRTLMAMVAMLLGAAALPLAQQLPAVIDAVGMM